MDIERYKKLAAPRMESGQKIEAVRDVIKQEKDAGQDAYEGVSRLFSPIIDVQKSVKQTIDDKQDKLMKELPQNQKAITSGLEDVILFNQLPETVPQKPINFTSKLPA